MTRTSSKEEYTLPIAELGAPTTQCMEGHRMLHSLTFVQILLSRACNNPLPLV